MLRSILHACNPFVQHGILNDIRLLLIASVCASCRACKPRRQLTLAMSVEKITIGSNIPAYEVGEKSAPAVIVLQVGDRYVASASCEILKSRSAFWCRNGGA